MTAYTAYKPTNYNWLGDVPAHWRWLYLQQACREQKIKNVGNTEGNVLSLSYGKIIRKKNIASGLVPKDYATYQIVENGNIILRLTDLQNDHRSLRTGLATERGIITSAYTCLLAFENPVYLEYLLHAYDCHKLFYGLGGGVRQSIGYEDIRYLSVAVPPREEQDQIVRFLDWKVSKINLLINNLKKQIALLNEQKQAIINKAVTKGLDDNAPMKNSKTLWSGSIPRSWTTCKLKQLARFQSGTNLTSLQIADFGDYPVYGGNGLRGYYPEYNYDGEYLLVGRQGALCGNVHIVHNKFWATDHAVTVKVNDFVDLYWLYYMLLTMNLNQYSRAAAQPGLSVEYVVNVPTYFPDFTEQQHIAEWIKTKVKPIDIVIESVERQISLVTEYRTRLISDVVTGKIDVRGVVVPEFESVEEVAEELNDEVDSEIGEIDNEL